jgi:alcohol dehydrogenase class IV
MKFEFATAGRILFGSGSSSKIDAIAAEFGSKPLLITGQRGATGTSLVIPGEPTVDMAREGAAICREYGFDVVIAMGGGSVIDAAKAIAALATNSGEPLDYVEVVGRGQTLTCAPLPVIAVPTTAGTGSEVTKNAVLGSPEHGVKVSLRHAGMLPRAAIVDPDLTLDLPPEITASTGLDALTQLIEPYVSVRANAFVDMLCLEGIRRVGHSLTRACSNGHDVEARTGMSYAALLGGMALANAGLGVVHGFAAPIGGMFKAPHGAVCAALLPHGIEANLKTMTDKSRYATIAGILAGRQDPQALVDYVRQLCVDLHIPGLRAYGVTEAHMDDLVDKAARASSMKANPVQLPSEVLRELVHAAL